MRNSIVSKAQKTVIDSLYKGINKYPQVGRFAALPVAVLETSISLGSIPLKIIEDLALVPINAVGCCFSKKFSLKDMVFSLLHGVISIPVGILTLPIAPAMLAVQTLNILIRPHHAKSLVQEILSCQEKPYSASVQ